ncbi:MAG: glutaminyl-peptide cyclotransferase, partial [Anaerolineae bacterium]|nr:glutaminyl-peptide cyclotransferase [Anaerolineae bacterium]
ITWKDEVATVYDLATFDILDQYTYSGEGWGLCYDGEYIYMSDGNPFLQVRDPETFELLFSLAVTYQSWTVSSIPSQGQYVNLGRLNELECAGDYVYANVWKSDFILRIDKTNGVVTGLIDASGLVSAEDRAEFEAGRDVLNGIVYLPETDTFLLTGKRWPTMYEVRLVLP